MLYKPSKKPNSEFEIILALDEIFFLNDKIDPLMMQYVYLTATILLHENICQTYVCLAFDVMRSMKDNSL